MLSDLGLKRKMVAFRQSKSSVRPGNNSFRCVAYLKRAIALDGIKAVGKMETAARRAETILKPDTETGKQLISADPKFASFPPGTILIDEWQKLPQCWDYVRRAVDDGAEPARFVMTGSATPESRYDTDGGVGRIISFRMRPMAIFERGTTTPTVNL